MRIQRIEAGGEPPRRPARDDDCRRVTVRGATRRVDLALPALAPIAELTPALARLCRAEGHDPDRTPPVWTLRPVGAEALDLGASLAEAGVADGDVLELADAAAWRGPRRSEQEGAATPPLDFGPRWRAGTTAAVLAAAAAVVVLAACALAIAAFTVSSDAVRVTASLLAMLSIACLAIALRVVPGGRAWRPARLALVWSGWLAGGTAAWGLEGAQQSAAGVAGAAGPPTLAALGAYPVVPAASPGAALASATLAAGSIAVASGAPLDAVAAAVAAAGLVALQSLPRVASLLAADRVAPGGPAADWTAVARVVRRSRELVASLSVGTVVVVTAAAAVTFATGGPVPIAIGAVAMTALALSARLYRSPLDTLPRAVAAGIALVVMESALATRQLVPGGRSFGAVGLLAATGLALAGLSMASARGDAGR